MVLVWSSQSKSRDHISVLAQVCLTPKSVCLKNMLLGVGLVGWGEGEGIKKFKSLVTK